LVAALVSAGAVMMTGAGSAGASTGPAFTSPEQAGYAVTGARFIVAETWVRLPDAARFSAEISQLGVSVQLWTPGTVIELTARRWLVRASAKRTTTWPGAVQPN
jgi:hypothetical protein